MFSNTEEMADNETDLLIDGKSVYSLRVVDLKQELKKRDIPFKTNASKAQLQALLIQHLSQSIDTNEEDKSSEDNSRLTTHSEDTNETIESNSEANNVQTFEDKRSEQQIEATDLSQDSGITSSVSFGDKHSIKLTIKLQPNDSPTKQLSPRMSPRCMSPKKSPTKEIRSPVRVEEVRREVLPEKEVTPEPQQQIASSEPLSQEMVQKEVIEEVMEQKSVEELPPKEVFVEKPKQSIPQKVIHKESESQEVIADHKSPKPIDSSSDDSKELNEKSEEIIETKDSEKDEANKIVIEDNIIISEEVSEDLIEQKNESESSEKESITSSQNISEDKTKDSPIEEPILQKVEQKREKSTEKEEKSKESEVKEEKAKERPPRRRRWGGSVSNDVQQNTRKGISSDQLKELIPDLGSTDNSNTPLKVSKSDSIVVMSSLSRTQTTEANHEMPQKRDIRVVRKSVSVTEEEPKNSSEEVKDILSSNAESKTKIVVQIESEPKSESEDKREVSPPRSSESNIVFIRNLVRPFTLLQLKDFLGKTGKLNEERFWIDKIKSKCFATYETVEEAIATRLALHGTRWPSSNPKLLSVDFATNEDLDSHLRPELIKDLNNKKNDNEVNQKYDIVIRSEEQRNALKDKENKNESRPIREWDREKLVTKEDDRRSKRRPNSPTTRSRSQEKETKRRRIGEERVRPADSTSEQEPAAEAVKRAESPAKLLDDLFRKTTATPSIYWLPLTEEQSVARLAAKEEEEKKRTEERIAREEQFRKRQEERRPPFDGQSPPFRNFPERNQWRTDSPPNRRNFGRRGSPPRRSPPPGRRSPPRRRSPANRYSRSRSPNPRRKR